MYNILLLNPPGNGLYVRDYYCSKVSKARYIYQPIDLVILSGILAKEHRIKVLDAIIEKLTFQKCYERIMEMDIDTIVFLTGSVSIDSDFEFIRKVKKVKKVLTIASGDVLMDNGKNILENEDCLDGIILDFTNTNILKYLSLENIEPIDNIIYKTHRGIVAGERVRGKGEFEIPIPKHELFPNEKYTYPFVKKRPFATVLTDYGCPYRCSFCIINTLGYKYRSVRNVIEELRYINSYGIEEVYFADQTFGANKEGTIKLCQEIINNKLHIGWVCFSRVDIVDEPFLQIMKKAGCHTIVFGVESGNEGILKKYRKNISKDQIIKAFSLCKRNKIETVATFLIGLPEEDEAKVMETIEFSKSLRCDYASFNVGVPRANTDLRKEAIENNLISPNIKIMDQSGSYAVMGTKYLAKDRVIKLKNKAIRKFYFRPLYIFSKLLTIRSLWDINRYIGEGIVIFRKAFENEIQTKVFFENWKSYQEEAFTTYQELYKNTGKMIERELAGVLLDVGNGGIFNYNVKKLKSIIAVDLYIKQSNINDNRIIFINADFKNNPFKGKIFNCVLMQHFIHHLAGDNNLETEWNVVTCINESYRVLKHGGKIIIVESCLPTMLEFIEEKLFKELYLLLKIFKKPMVKMFSFKKISEFMTNAGFHSIKRSEINMGKFVSQFGLKVPSKVLPHKLYLITGLK